VYFAPAGFFLLQSNLGQLPGGEYTGESQLSGDEYTGESRLPGDEHTKESQLPGGEYTGELIKNTSNSLSIRKNLKSFLGVSNGTSKSCLMKKKTESKNLMTLSLYVGPCKNTGRKNTTKYIPTLEKKILRAFT
jgi:hypothetical protein